MTKKQEERTEPKAWASGIPVYCAHDAIVKISELRPNPMNPNKHPPEQIKKLGGVIRRNGWRQPVTVSTRSGMIVKGHGRLMAAELEELEEAPVDYQDYESEAAEMADLWADNYIAELAETDQQLEASLLAGIQQAGEPLELAGSSQEEYDAIVQALTAGEDAEEDDEDEDPEEDEPIEPPAAPVTQRGDVWILGRHRVMCGDCTKPEERDLLLDGARPEVLLTDPPYCSGGQKESQKSTGSIGTDRKDKKTPMMSVPKGMSGTLNVFLSNYAEVKDRLEKKQKALAHGRTSRPAPVSPRPIPSDPLRSAGTQPTAASLTAAT